MLNVWMNLPVKPAKQLQRNSPGLSTQAPFRQGLESHSLTSISQYRPMNPFGQSHVKLFTLGTHWPPWAQGADRHISVT